MDPPDPEDPPDPPDPKPVLGKSVVAGVVSGIVRIKLKGGKFRRLRADESIPVGSTVDATKGRVNITSAAGKGKTQSADFYKGVFVITQTRGSKPITQLALSGKLSCPKKKATHVGQEEEGPAAVGRRQGPLPHQGQARRRHRQGHALADRGPLRPHQGDGQARHGHRPRLQDAKNKTVKKGHSYVARG